MSAFGTHCLDLIRWFMVPVCGEVMEINLVAGSPLWQSPNEETAVEVMRFESGATAEFLVSVLFECERRVEVFGEKGCALCRDTLGPDGGGAVTVRGEQLDFAATNPYVAEMADFAEAIRTGRPPAADGQEGLRNLDLLQRATR